MEVTSENEIIEKFINTFELNGGLCRLCLKKPNQAWNLFEIGNDLPKKIMACAHIQVHQGDGLPTVICLTCRQLLDVSYNFKCQVEKSDLKLREIYHLKATLPVEYETTAVVVNGLVKQSVNPVLIETIEDEIKTHSDPMGNNLKNRGELEKLTTSDSTVDHGDNNLQQEILFNVDNNHGNYNNNKHHHHNLGEMTEVIRDKANENEKIIDEMSRVAASPANNISIKKLDEFEIKEEKNCILNVEQSELSDGDDNNVYTPNEIFIEQEEKINIMETIHEKNEHCSKKKVNDDEGDDNDEVEEDDDEEDDNDDDDDDDDENDNDDNDEDCEDDDDAGGNKNKNNGDADVNQDCDYNRGDGEDKIMREKKAQNDNEEKLLSSQTLRHKCLNCIKTFTSTSALQRHATIHNNGKTKLRYVCYMCDKQFATVSRLKNHVLSTHDSLKNSESNNSGNGEKICTMDEISGKNDKKNLKFACKYCPKQFTYEKPFLTHAKRHPEYKNELENESIKLENEFSSRYSERERSYESEEDEMPQEGLQCTQCGKLFATKRNLTRHLSTHTGLKFNCTTCTKEFSRLDKLKEHEQIKHKNEFFVQSDDDDDDDSDNETKPNGSECPKKDKYNRPHKCLMCPKAFAQAQSLTNHMERHKRVKDTQKRFLCEVCSKCFSQSGSLVAHMRTHTGVKPYVCNVCSRAFTKSTYLQLHLRTHSGEKPYICQYCSRAFARANTLARHITMHTGEAKYHCQICMKSFRRLTSLNEHTYTHTGQRPYACKICTKRYNNAGSLYAHTKKCKAQALNTSINSTSYNNINTNEDINNHSGDSTTSAMLIYSQRKIPNDTTNVTNIVTSQSTITSTPSFTLANNIHNQKSSLATNIIQQYTIEESNVYTTDVKYKNPYYTIFPGI